MNVFERIRVNAICRTLFLLTPALTSAAWAACNPALKVVIAADRYQINADNTVRDKLTDLIWMRCPAGYNWNAAELVCTGEGSLFSWVAALEYAAAAGAGWRLPNTKELESLVQRDCFDPAVETSVFSSLQLGYHWTSTAALEGSGAWALNMRNGGLTVTDKTNLYSVRLVRDVH